MDQQIRVDPQRRASGWEALVDPPGEAGTGGAEQEVFAAGPGRLTTGLWRREPDTWSFVRPYHEVAVILAGDADVGGRRRDGPHPRPGRRPGDPEGLGGDVADPRDDREVLHDPRGGLRGRATSDPYGSPGPASP